MTSTHRRGSFTGRTSTATSISPVVSSSTSCSESPWAARIGDVGKISRCIWQQVWNRSWSTREVHPNFRLRISPRSIAIKAAMASSRASRSPWAIGLKAIPVSVSLIRPSFPLRNRWIAERSWNCLAWALRFGCAVWSCSAAALNPLCSTIAADTWSDETQPSRSYRESPHWRYERSLAKEWERLSSHFSLRNCPQIVPLYQQALSSSTRDLTLS